MWKRRYCAPPVEVVAVGALISPVVHLLASMEGWQGREGGGPPFFVVSLLWCVYCWFVLCFLCVPMLIQHCCCDSASAAVMVCCGIQNWFQSF
jgi:hypothetical protein